MNDLPLLSASRLAALIRAGEISATDAVEAHVAQIERVNPRLNAVVRTRFDEARAEAGRADELRARARAPRTSSVHGAPCTIKECFALTGMPNASGLVARRNVVSERDATAVARFAPRARSRSASPTRPYLHVDGRRTTGSHTVPTTAADPDRIVGGSSGGEGAIVGAGGSPLGLGLDVGGSIRGPCVLQRRVRPQADRRHGARDRAAPDRRGCGAALLDDRPRPRGARRT
ncbi:MAG: amidase family protein [Candidatus Binatia bacterium]